jgi:hypothetical protein
MIGSLFDSPWKSQAQQRRVAVNETLIRTSEQTGYSRLQRAGC